LKSELAAEMPKTSEPRSGSESSSKAKERISGDRDKPSKGTNNLGEQEPKDEVQVKKHKLHEGR